jgi:RTX calcium-binding nonapeptide repeat (4 copies)
MNDRYCRPSRSRSAGFGLLTCVAVLAFAPAASAAEKVTICHATGSATNPYVQVTISENAVPAHKRHQDRQDIIPAPATGCPDLVVPPPPPPPPPPIDVCPNLLGDQATVPDGSFIDANGNCVPVVVEPPPFVPCIVSIGVTQTATTVTGTPADDTIDCSAVSPGRTIDGLGGNDTITATQFDDIVTGGEGNDTITGLGGNDTLSGNTGNDTISAGEGNDTITGSEGNDTLSGEAGDDFVDGGDDDDVLSGGTGINTLIGGNGTDTCDGGPCTV